MVDVCMNSFAGGVTDAVYLPYSQVGRRLETTPGPVGPGPGRGLVEEAGLWPGFGLVWYVDCWCLLK